jgi:mannose-1-phosphate guanylyltransferase
VFEPSMLDRIPAGRAVSVERETFPALLEDGGALFALGTDDYWLDIGTPDKYLRAHLDVLAGELGFPPAPGATEQAPGIWTMGENDVAPDAILVAPVFLGTGAVVGAGARLADCTVEAGATVGAGARIENAVVSSGAGVGRRARIVDSIIGPDGTVGDDAVVIDHSIVGAGARVDAGITLAGSRVELPAKAG